jgi:hypothetical protein
MDVNKNIKLISLIITSNLNGIFKSEKEPKQEYCLIKLITGVGKKGGV